MVKLVLTSLVLLLLGAQAALAQDAGDPAKGLAVFSQCKACHHLEAGRNGLGPSLHGLFGRKAGTAPQYNYSEAMKKSGITWDAATLDKYITDPKAVVPGDKMPYPGLKDAAKRRDLLAYLKQATQ